MGVYIKGMGFPCEEIEPMIFEVYADGTVYAYTDKKRVDDFLELKAVEVKAPHGRLIDAKAFEIKNKHFWHRDFINAKSEDALCDLFDEAPTVLKAEGKDDG